MIQREERKSRKASMEEESGRGLEGSNVVEGQGTEEEKEGNTGSWLGKVTGLRWRPSRHWLRRQRLLLRAGVGRSSRITLPWLSPYWCCWWQAVGMLAGWQGWLSSTIGIAGLGGQQQTAECS